MGRISFITENTVDQATDINESIKEIDGLIPMAVESIDDTPVVESAEIGKYYAENDYVLTPNDVKTEYIKSYPQAITYSGAIYIVDGGSWEPKTAPSFSLEGFVKGSVSDTEPAQVEGSLWFCTDENNLGVFAYKNGEWLKLSGGGGGNNDGTYFMGGYIDGGYAL